jgi:hypothetical protein
MAGFGMARYHLRTREAGWRRRLVINTAGGIYTALVVVLCWRARSPTRPVS